MRYVLRIGILGVTASLRANDGAFESFVAENYGRFCAEGRQGDEADAEISVEFAAAGSRRESEWFDRARGENPDRIGTGVWQGSNSVLYVYSPYCAAAQRRGDGIVVRALFQMTKRFRLLRRSSSPEVAEHYQALMRLAVHFPMFHLLQDRGYSVLHASLASRGDEGVLFMGLNGSGKTTAALSLAPEMTLAADNFALFDGSRAFGYPELIRVSPETAESLHLEVGGELVYGKAQIRSSGSSHSGSVPRLCVITRIGNENRWERVAREEAVRYLDAGDRFTHENHLYSYLAFLGSGGHVAKYPECEYFAATMCGQEGARGMIRRKVGEILGL